MVWDDGKKRTTRGPLRIDHTVLQVAVARLLGYRWPAELDREMRLAKEQRELVDYCAEFSVFADADGIVCLSPTRGEATAADRVRRLLAAAYDHEWSSTTEQALLAATSEKPPASLEDWLRDRFFQEHCKLFQNRPFVWHIWDGREDGFHALINYHRLAGPSGEGRRTLEAVTYSYLQDWITRQQQAQRDGVAAADARLVAALELRERLIGILEGEPPYDIFVRWKPVAEQPIGWNPDINDGVRLNIRPFMRAALRSGGRKGAGILRAKPNAKWTKDRGKEPQELRDREDFPWFWSCPGTGTAGAAHGLPSSAKREVRRQPLERPPLHARRQARRPGAPRRIGWQCLGRGPRSRRCWIAWRSAAGTNSRIRISTSRSGTGRACGARFAPWSKWRSSDGAYDWESVKRNALKAIRAGAMYGEAPLADAAIRFTGSPDPESE